RVREPLAFHPLGDLLAPQHTPPRNFSCNSDTKHPNIAKVLNRTDGAPPPLPGPHGSPTPGARDLPPKGTTDLAVAGPLRARRPPPAPTLPPPHSLGPAAPPPRGPATFHRGGPRTLPSRGRYGPARSAGIFSAGLRGATGPEGDRPRTHR